MKELQNIIYAFAKLQREGEDAALATVVGVSGSTYRRTGARMLITQYGKTVGTISGGCLERDVVLHARRSMEYNRPHLARYDLSFDEDTESGFVMGCNGTVDVLIEPIVATDPAMHFLSRCILNRSSGVIATVVAAEGTVGAGIASRMMLAGDNGPESVAITDAELECVLEHDLRKSLSTRESVIRQYDLRAGRATVLIEFIKPAQSVVLFGAGHDAIPLVHLSKELGWHVTVVDSKPGYATPDRFPSVDNRIQTRPAAAIERIAFDGDSTAAIVMNHNYYDDLEALRYLLPVPVGYIGMLGPRKRTERLIEDLRAEGVSIPIASLKRVYGPVGLDIGAEAPVEVALAIVAEIKAFSEGRRGGLSRDRKGPLHVRAGQKRLSLDSPTHANALQCALSPT